MKTLRYLLVAGLLSVVIAACNSNGPSADTTTTDTIAKAPKTEDNPFRLRLDTIKVVTIERDPNDSTRAIPVH